MIVKQRTLKDKFSVSGVGLHTGEFVTLTINPAPDNHGYKFQRIDLSHKPVIKADVDFVVGTERGTTLEQNGARVYTTEHVLAALYGMEIDNALIELDGPEIPILDGSSAPYVEQIVKIGTREQDEERKYFELKSNIKFENVAKCAEILAVPDNEMRITVMVDYNSPLLGTQHASMYNIQQFKEEISGCRTFVFLREVLFLHSKGLIKGGDVNNAIVMVDKPIPADELKKLREIFNKPDVEVQGIGMLNNVSLRHENEPARHKLLDIVGDVALAGMPIKAHILAARPGHSSNIEFARLLKEMMKKDKNAVPQFDLNKTIVDIDGIKKLLPHRYPFLLVDRIIELSSTHVVGIKNVTNTENFFQGHFPDTPIMPGVLIIEALAQTGGILALSTVPDPENYLTYFMKMDDVKFREKVIPGDTLILKMELITPIRRGIVHMRASAFVRDKVIATGDLMAQISKVKNIPVKNEPTVGVHTS